MKSSGGWMLGAANALLNNKEVKLYVASVSGKVNKFTKLEGQLITYYILPFDKGNQYVNIDYCPYWQQISEEIKLDI